MEEIRTSYARYFTLLSNGVSSEYMALKRMEVFTFFRFLREREKMIKEQNEQHKTN